MKIFLLLFHSVFFLTLCDHTLFSHLVDEEKEICYASHSSRGIQTQILIRYAFSREFCYMTKTKTKNQEIEAKQTNIYLLLLLNKKRRNIQTTILVQALTT